MTSTIAVEAAVGRHRWGTPGLVFVSEFVRVRRRNFLTALFRPGRHRMPTVTMAPAPNASPRPAI